jgi:hypothetical protein
LVTLILSPVYRFADRFNPRLSRSVFSSAQKAVYVASTNPLFDTCKTPQFSVILSIFKFFQHHLDHMQHHIGPVTREALSWHNAGVSPNHITKRDFEKSIEGEWIGLYSYLGWADFEALRDNNPAVLEANRAGHLRDYLGGPQQLTIQLHPPKSDPDYSSPESTPTKSSRSIPITGRGTNGGPFTFNGKLRRVCLPREIAGKDMVLRWRVTFVKTYANGENSWTRWIYDGIYCPGKSTFATNLMTGVGILGRWRDGTEPESTGVTGPFWLWPKETTQFTSPTWDDDSYEMYESDSSHEFATECSDP